MNTYLFVISVLKVGGKLEMPTLIGEPTPELKLGKGETFAGICLHKNSIFNFSTYNTFYYEFIGG